MKVYCPRCRRCSCPKCHAAGSCVDPRRRIFLMGALALPLAKKLTWPAVPAPPVYLTYVITPEMHASWRRGVYEEGSFAFFRGV